MKVNFPAEWHKQKCVQLTWPHIATDFFSKYEEAIDCFRNIAKEISKRQKLLIVTKNIQITKEELGDFNPLMIDFFECDTNDVWARDHGGITIFHNSNPIIYDFCFNGWGKKYIANKDNLITKKLCDSGYFNHYKYTDANHFVFEGGSIESNGNGVLLTTEECLLSKFRNPHLDKNKIEKFLKSITGSHTILWLSHGFLKGDDTDSHIDTLSRFVNEDTITYVQCLDENDLHYTELKAMENELKGLKKSNGLAYNLVPLPMTPAIYDEDNERLPATYANFLIINSAVLVPIYNCYTDSLALQIFTFMFPDKEIVPIDCSVLITQHGSLHCVTMQYPEI